MLISGIQLSKGIERNQSFYFMSSISFIGFLGTVIVVITFITLGHNLDAYLFFEELPDSAFKKIFFLGYFLFGLSMLGQPLYFRSLRQKVSTKTILISLGCLIPFFITVWSVGQGGSYLGRSFYVYIFILCLLSWTLTEASISNKHLPTIWFSLIRSTTLVFIGIFAIWMMILFVTNQQGYILGFTRLEITQFDISSRVLRGTLFIFLQLIILMHWMENFSYNAIELKATNSQVKDLLREKDMLIESLSNSSTLIESGALSAGLAHELNQFLGRIALNRDDISQLINRPGVKPEDLKLPLDNILKANQSAANLIVSLKKLFNQGAEDSSLSSVDELVKEVVSLYVGRIEKSNIEIVLDLQANRQQFIWESLFRQVVVNLLSNAIEALDAIAKSNKVIQIQSSIDQSGSYSLTFTDNGPGINAVQGAKIFNLFATSKSGGTGIGLWLSRYIVERHKGSLTYENLPDNAGVSFIISIPEDVRGNWGQSASNEIQSSPITQPPHS
jgi:signal transduction histidine kinase